MSVSLKFSTLDILASDLNRPRARKLPRPLNAAPPDQQPKQPRNAMHRRWRPFRFFSLIIFILFLIRVSYAQQAPVPLTLGWEYPTNDPSVSFVISQSTNLPTPITNWTVVTNVPRDQLRHCHQRRAGFIHEPSQRRAWSVFLGGASEQFLGLGSNSNVAATPPAPTLVLSNTISR
jgi:hypothetical protein